MEKNISVSLDRYTLAPFADADAFGRFLAEHGCDGSEAVLCDDGLDGIVAGRVSGLHLVFYPSWIDLWRGDFAALREEFGSDEAWKSFYGTDGPEGLLGIYKDQIKKARELGARYVVFHVGDDRLDEFYTLKYKYGDLEVARHSASFLNELMKDEEPSLALLLENLWAGGMTLLDARVTDEALSRVSYANTGLMLDTGHLLIADFRPKSESEAVRYIAEMLSRHGELAKYFTGMHLHRSADPGFLKSDREKPPARALSYLERFLQTMSYVSRADAHGPFTKETARRIADLVQPKFLTHELAHGNRANWREALKIQSF